MFGGNIQQPMDFRDYGHGAFGMPYYPNPIQPYGPFIGPSSFQSAGAGYMPLSGMPSYGRSLQYASAQRRSNQLKDFMLQNDPRGELIRRTLGVKDGIISDIGVGLLNRGGINHLFGGDIRDVVSASMLAASGGIYTKRGQTFAGGMLQQAYATEIAKVVTGGMDSRGMTNGLNVSRTAETVAALSAVSGGPLSGRILHQGGGRIGMSSTDKADLEGVIDSSTKLVRDLEQIFGDGTAVSDLFSIAKRVTGKVVRTQKDADDMSRTIRSIAAQGVAAGLDERAMFDVLAQGNKYNSSVSAPVNLAMNTATAPFVMGAARAGGVDVMDALDVHQRAQAEVAASPVAQRAMVAFALAEDLREGGKSAEADKLEELARGLTTSNFGRQSKAMEAITGKSFSQIDALDVYKQRAMEQGSNTAAGANYLSNASADVAAKYQDPIRLDAARIVYGEGKEREAADMAEAFKLVGVSDLSSVAALMAQGIPWDSPKMQAVLESSFSELDPTELERVRQVAEDWTARVGGEGTTTKSRVGAILKDADRFTDSMREVADNSTNALRRSRSNMESYNFYGKQMQEFGYTNENNLPALELLKGLAGNTETRGMVRAIADVASIEGAQFGAIKGLDPRAFSQEESKEVLQAIKADLVANGRRGDWEKVMSQYSGSKDHRKMLAAAVSGNLAEAVQTLETNEAGEQIGVTKILTEGAIGKARELADNMDWSGEITRDMLGKSRWIKNSSEHRANLIERVDSAPFWRSGDAVFHMKDPGEAAKYLLRPTGDGPSELEKMLFVGDDKRFNKTVKSWDNKFLGYMETVLESKPYKDLNDGQKEALQRIQEEKSIRQGKEKMGQADGSERTHLGVVSFVTDQGDRVVLTPLHD